VNVATYIPAPALCQGADEDVIVEIGEIVFPDFVLRNKHNGRIEESSKNRVEESGSGLDR